VKKIKPRITKSVGNNIVSQFLNVGGQIVLVPIFLYFWGVEKYGLWLILLAVSGWFSLVDLGIGHHLPNKLTSLRVTNRLRLYNAILGSFLSIHIISAGVFFILGVGLSALLVGSNFLDYQNLASNSEVLYALILLIFWQISQSLFNFSGVVYASTSDYHKTQLRKNQNITLNFVLILLGLFLGWGFVGISLVLVFSFAIVEIISLLDIKKNYHFAQLKLVLCSYRLIKKIYQESVWFISVKGYDIGYQNIPILMLQEYFSATMIVVFSVHRTLVSTITQAKQIIQNTIWRESSILYSTRNIVNIARLYLFSQKIIIYLLTLLMALVLFNGPYIFSMWLGGEVNFDPDMAILMLIIAVSQVVWSGAENIAYSWSKVNDIFFIKISYLLLYVAVTFISLHWYQNVYYMIALNALLNVLFLDIFILKKVHSYLKISNYLYFSKVISRLLLLFLLMVIFQFIAADYLLLVVIVFTILSFDLYKFESENIETFLLKSNE